MRVLFTIPHFYQAKAQAGHGSEGASADARAGALTLAIASLHQTFGTRQALNGPLTPVNDLLAAEIDVVVCTTGDSHVADRLPARLFRHRTSQAEPKLLGYECHVVLAENLGRFDWYCFLEDDTLITDALMFRKLAWFSAAVGEHAVLQPQRYEIAVQPPIQKLYIDGPMVDRSISPRLQDKSIRPRVTGRVFGHEVVFERTGNPHSGCFFLSARQMETWHKKPYFLDRSSEFWGPLESAATLGLMKTFHVYKPALANAAFFEVRHLDHRYLGKRLKLAPDFDIRAPRPARGQVRPRQTA